MSIEDFVKNIDKKVLGASFVAAVCLSLGLDNITSLISWYGVAIGIGFALFEKRAIL